MLDIYLIRHAESEMNKNSHLISGRLNETPLSEKGIYQANLLGKRLKDSNVVFNELYSSIAKRTIETARIVIQHLDYSLDDIIKTTELLELDQGEWEGKPREEIYTPEVLAQITSDNWNFTPPCGESQRAVEERMLRWVNKNLTLRYSEGLTVGIFTHIMSIKCLLRGIMDFSPTLTYKVNIDNTSITRLKYTNLGWHLVTVNDTAHLYSSASKSKRNKKFGCK